MKKATRTHAQRATDYAKDVVAGRILACRQVRQACQRHLDNLKASKRREYPFTWDAAKCNKVLQFGELLPHVKGKWALEKQNIRWEDWQCFVYGVPFGWVKKKTKMRRFRRVYIEVPRKNAKSTGTAVVGNYMLTLDGEHGAEVYSGAGSEKQAWEVFGPARLMVQNTPELRDEFGITVGARNLSIGSTNAKFEPVIGKPGDGPSPSFSITDEYHEHATADQYDTFVTGMGAREQPIAWVITTAGESVEGPCYALRDEVIAMLDGTIPNEELFGIVYTIDEDVVDWTSETALRMANPNLGVSVGEEYLRSQQRDAINNPRKQSTFKTKHLNVWVTAANPYFNTELWRRLNDAPPIDEFRGEPCWIGLDLGAKLDLVSASRLFQREQMGTCARCHGTKTVREDEKDAESASVTCPRCDGAGSSVEPHYFAYVRSYLPQARADDPATKHYAQWAIQGHVITTPGNVTDFDAIEDDIKRDTSLFRVVSVLFDPWNATQLTGHLSGFGVECIEVPMTVQHLSEPMKELQALIVDGRIHHDGNPATTWAIGNVVAQEDRNENVFPRKPRTESKIDPVVAMMLSLSGSLRGDGRSVYDSSDVKEL